MVKNKKYNRRLDSQAKVFTLVSNSKYCSVFRFTVRLKEKIDGDVLLKAYKGAFEKFKAYKVKLHFGLFEYSLVQNDKEPKIFEVDEEPVIKKINNKDNNDYLVKLTYSGEELYFDFYHALTDGTGAVKFIRDVLGRYFELKYNTEEKEYLLDKTVIQDSEDIYVKLSSKYEKISYPFSEGYRVFGTTRKDDNVEINHFSLNINEFKNKAKEKGATISMYITAIIAYTFYLLSRENKYKQNRNGKDLKPINLCIPISLEKYFEEKTLSNFFSHMFVSFDLKEKKEYTFDEMLESTKSQYEEKIKLEKIMGVLNGNITKMNNPVLKVIPLAIKKFSFVAGSLKMKKQFSMTVSNVGKLEYDPKFNDYIDSSYVTLACDWAEKVKCGICSYKDEFIISFCSNIYEKDFENIFKTIIEELGFDYEIFGNNYSLMI